MPKPAPVMKNRDESPPLAVEQECLRLIHSADNAAAARAAAQRIRELMAFWPEARSLCLAHALVMEKTRCREGMLELWTQTHLRSPDNLVALRYRLRWLARSRRAEDGAALIEERLAKESDPANARLLRAQLLAELRDDALVKSILETHLREHPEDAATRVFYAQKLRDWGDGQAALDVVAPLLAKPDAPRRLQDFASELRAAMDVLRRRDPEFGRDNAPLFVAALRTAIRLRAIDDGLRIERLLENLVIGRRHEIDENAVPGAGGGHAIEQQIGREARKNAEPEIAQRRHLRRSGARLFKRAREGGALVRRQREGSQAGGEGAAILRPRQRFAALREISGRGWKPRRLL